MSLRERLIDALALKALPRAGWLRAGIGAPESVAAHSWGVTWLVLVLCPDDLDLAEALAMATVHDLPEVVAGDITPHDGISRADKQARERAALDQLLRELPRAERMRNLWEAYDRGESAVARFVKACDKLDMALQAAAYERLTGADLRAFVDSALERLEPGPLRVLAEPADAAPR